MPNVRPLPGRGMPGQGRKRNRWHEGAGSRDTGLPAVQPQLPQGVFPVRPRRERQERALEDNRGHPHAGTLLKPYHREDGGVHAHRPYRAQGQHRGRGEQPERER